MRRYILAVFSLTLVVVHAACGGSQPPPNPAAGGAEVDASAPKESADAGASSTSSASGSSGTAVPPKSETSAFDALSKDKKIEVMATKVVPSVGKLFKEHDGEKFGRFGCANCHGRGDKKNDDPRKVLPKLTFSNGGYEKLAKEKPAIMKLMNDKVVPAMATALGEKPFDPATKQGFTCTGCHTVD